MTYAFRPLARADLPLLRQWRARPHWVEWWGTVEEGDDFAEALADPDTAV